uniref:MADF domain-containing protein n=1 Tax=Anopheles dirus TaxID=7168 RepID=A0A182N428_9DIPT
MASSSQREFITEFITLYQRFPCLWDATAREYFNRTEKRKAYDRLVQKYREVDKKATHETVARKINGLRTCYRREVAKIRKSLQSGIEGDIYKPTLWYYKLFAFLDDVKVVPEEKKPAYDDCEVGTECKQNAYKGIVERVEIEYVTDEEHIDSNDYVFTGEERLHSACRISSSTFARQAPTSKRKPSPDGQRNGKRTNRASKCDDCFDVYGKHISHKLRSLSQHQNTMAQKLINDVLFEAEMATLNRHCRIVQS